MTELPQTGLTVILPTLDRGEWLLATVRQLLDQHFAPLEILIVDQSDRADEGILSLARGLPEVISYHHVSFRGLPPARNYGWQRARYDAILFLDDDIECSPGLLAEHARTLRTPGVGIVAGAVDQAADRDRQPPVEPTGQLSRLTGIPTRGFHVRGEFDVDHAPGGNFSVWKKVLRACGGIDEGLNVGAALYEEADFCLRARRAGYRIRFNGAARILHLAVPRGGCRVPAVSEYVWGLAHNRAIMIWRHVEWYFRPVALGRLLITTLSYGFRARDLQVLTAAAGGVIRGIAHSGDK